MKDGKWKDLRASMRGKLFFLLQLSWVLCFIGWRTSCAFQVIIIRVIRAFIVIVMSPSTRASNCSIQL
jgi:hypothetical protein